MSCPDSYTPAHDRAPVPRSDAAQRFAHAIEQHDHRSRSDTTDLRGAACAYVAELKAQSWPPERVLVQVKDLLRSSSGYSDDNEQRQLLQQVITWCIEAYYGAEDRS